MAAAPGVAAPADTVGAAGRAGPPAVQDTEPERDAAGAGARWRLALVVIARDEAPRIGRLLASVAPWVDTMLVLDTGSRDDTAAVARAHGARVEHFAWCDDFAAARNAALALAASDWHLVLDADEWLADGGAALAALRHTAPGFVGTVQLQDQGAAAGTVRDRLSRVLPGALRYRGRVHEQPQHALPLQALAVTVGHDGYSAERMAAKRGRNRALLLAELAAAPDDAYLLYQLGKDFAAYGEHADAATALAQAASRTADIEAWRHDLAARCIHALKMASRHAQALDFAEARMADNADSPDFFFALGDAMLDWAATRPEHGMQLLPLAEAAWQRCLEIGERPAQAGSVQGRGSYLAAHNLAVVFEGLGRHDAAAGLRALYPAPAGAMAAAMAAAIPAATPDAMAAAAADPVAQPPRSAAT